MNARVGFLTWVAFWPAAVLAQAGEALQQIPDRGMSAAHFVYIPACIAVGVVVGYLIGSRLARAEARTARRNAPSSQDRDTP